MKQNKLQDPYEVELLDLWNEVGGQLVIKYHRATITPTKEDLQQLHDNNLGTDVMHCVIMALAGHGMSREEVLAFMQEAQAAGAAPSVTFEAAEGEALNIKNKEENPLFDVLVQAVENQGKEVSHES